MLVSIIVVNFNTRELTAQCISSIYKETSVPFEIIVVDNASSDGSAEVIRAKFPSVHLIASGQNLGFAAGNNMGAKAASGDLILLLNSDTIVLTKAIDRLVTFARQHEYAGIWGGRTVFSDGSLNPTNCWRFMTLWSLFAQAVGLTTLGRNNSIFNREGYGGWARNTVREVDFVSGCFLLISRSMWDSIGGFDERFYMYAEEADLCHRARQIGARPMITPEACVVHYGGKSDTARAIKLRRLLAGKVLFLKKHWQVAPQVAGINLLKLLVLIRALSYSLSALLSRSKMHSTVAQEWRDVWASRKVWADGQYS